ncbi:MFS transporter [Anaerocolumna jejuensis]|uniref:MFS transporter n=1 Tax=Anaerocolumna jejuensis TaxID=259063 RepID=UPI003F7C5FC6
MSDKKFRNFIIFWLSQSVSQLGSAMTGFALIIWAYKQTNSALTVSLMSFCSYVPYVFVSIFSGPLIDRHKKKTIMVITDLMAALCSLGVLVLYLTGRLRIQDIYLVNFIIGFMDAFQAPAASAAVSIMVPENKYAKASGMDSFTSNLVTVSAPMLASVILAVVGIKGVILADLVTFLFAVLVLTAGVSMKEDAKILREQREPYLTQLRSGFLFLGKNRGLLGIMLSLALMNFFSRLTYENILSPMLIARSGGNSGVYGFVSAVLGIGGIIGGIWVSVGRGFKSNRRMIYLPAAFSFLFGDILMGIGRNVYIWSLAGLAASMPMPFIMAGQRVMLYERVPKDMQGRVFSARNAIQFSTIPIGILLGGILADHVFEPFMASDSPAAKILGTVVGSGRGSGMAVMFLFSGILGFLESLIGYRNKEIRKLERM